MEFGSARGRIAVLAIAMFVAGSAAEAGAVPARGNPEPTTTVRVQFKHRGKRALAREFRVRAADAAAFVRAWNASPEVAWADVAPKPAPLPAKPAYDALQTYRRPAPNGGLDSNFANLLPGGRGENVRVVDIEYNWNFAHEDLSKLRAGTARVTGDVAPMYYGETDHGTAVIGVMGGDANRFGITGMAPAAEYYAANAVTADGYNIARAIYAALERLRPGDVLLLEQQTDGPYGCSWTQYGCVPIEWENGAYDAIVDATAAGVIVVEAAGNGSQDLDRPEYGARFPKGKPDSGAIVVGAGNPGGCGYPTPVRSRLYFSNWGSRVDVQGWGDCITTTGYGELGGLGNAKYTALFGGTSGAAAQVAAAAASLSGVAKARGTTLTSTQVRTLLRANGTPQPNETKRIGPLPDLRRAVAALAPAPKPALSGPTYSVVPGATLTGTIPTVVQWAGSDATGVTEYKVWKSIAGGAYTPVALPTSTTRSMKFSLTPRQRYAFAVMARNAKGAWSEIKVAVVTPRVVQELDPNVTYGSGWHRIVDPGASGGYTERTTVRRTTATVTFTGSQLTVFATRGLTRGVFDVYLDGVLKDRLNLAGPARKAWAARTYRWPAVGRHTLRLRSPNDGKLVDVDAFVTS